jgi:hypothetical protein
VSKDVQKMAALAVGSLQDEEVHKCPWAALHVLAEQTLVFPVVVGLNLMSDRDANANASENASESESASGHEVNVQVSSVIEV